MATSKLDSDYSVNTDSEDTATSPETRLLKQNEQGMSIKQKSSLQNYVIWFPHSLLFRTYMLFFIALFSTTARKLCLADYTVSRIPKKKKKEKKSKKSHS
jgi:hypothetical protein